MSAAIAWPAVLLIGVLGIGVVALWMLARQLRSRRPIPDEMRRELAEAPMSPLQRRAWIALGVVLTALIASFGIIAGSGGAQVYWDDDSVRLPVTGIFIAALVLHMLILYVPMQLARKGQGYDERDRRILASSPAFQSAAMLLTMAAWNIYLVESFRPERLIPSVYLYLIFGSMLFAQMIATDLGVLFGYWSGAGDAEG